MYVTEMSDEVFEACTRNLKSWCPDHQPLLTCVAVKELGLEGMRVEIEVVAHDEEGARKASGVGEHCKNFEWMY
jgi:enamine deaminase RidA (YjgF/YER057c/UK114 family)